MAPQPRLRSFRSHVVVVLTGIVVSLGISGVSAGSVSPPPSTRVPMRISGSHIRSYLRLPGDQVVVVPDGTYTGGNVTAPHPETGGQLKGWLVLVAQHPHGVVVDLSSAMLNLYPTTSRIMFVGFKFVNGVVKMQAVDNIRFWYCEHTFPAAEWYRQWVAAGGGHDVSQAQGLKAMNKMANPHPSAIKTAQYNGVASKHVQILGADIHDVGGSGITLTGDDLRVIGTRIWNIDEGTADPGYGGKEVQPINGQKDAFHNDAIFTGGGAYGTVVQHSYLGQRTQWGAQTGNVKDSRFEDLWMAGSPTAGIVVDAIDRTNSGRLSGIVSFGNRYGLRVDIKRGSPSTVWPDVYYPALTTSGIDINAPAGTLDASGHIIDAVVLAHPDNPANRWRAANPYDTWRTLFN